ncbi:MAG: hypothetical protein ABIT83_25370 [Massilia sp.]
MKNPFAIILVLLLAIFAWHVMWSPADMSFSVNGEDLDNPLGAVFGVLFGGVGIVIAGIVLFGVGVLLTVVFAGVGVVVAGALALAAVVTLAALSPLLLPLLIPVAILALLLNRSRRRRN